MSKRKCNVLNDNELQQVADNFGSDDEDWEPFEPSDSEYICSSESETESSDTETLENIRKYIARKKSKQNPQSNANTEPNLDLEVSPSLQTNLRPEPNLEHTQNTEPAENTYDWGPVVGNYKNISRFSVSSGIIPEVAGLLANGKPGDFFDAVVDDRIINLICDYTNLYATNILLTTNAAPSSRLHNWTPTTPTEIRQFLGLIAWMGLVKMPKIADYWSILFAQTFSKNIMSRNRFELLLKMLHFADNSEINKGDKLYKLRPLIDNLVINFKSMYVPEEYICVDESLLPLRGRLAFRQYIKSKRHKYGVKVFKVCCGLGPETVRRKRRQQSYSTQCSAVFD